MAKSQQTPAPHSLEFVPDRGPAKYFHGRKKVLNDFNNLLQYASQKPWGTTFLVQGAPGAGKTALLEEMASNALENQWDVVDINLDDLYNPVHMAQTIGGPYVARKQTVTKLDVKLLSGEYIREVSGDSSVTRVLENMNSDHGVVLILDEAQRIDAFSATAHEVLVMGTLDTLHNGKLPHPVILLAAGLGTTLRAFGKFRISRFAEDCFVELGALSKGSERAVIQDWLKKDGGAKGDPTAWIDAITQETHGWPQHIQSYAKRAVAQLKANDGTMTPSGLSAALEAGREGRKVYYKQRVVDFRADQIRCLARSMVGVPQGEPAEFREIISSLAQEYGEDEANNLFKRLEREGLLAQCGMGYAVPIPSMHAWLKNKYVQEKIDLPRQEQMGRGLPERSSRLER